MSLLFLTCFLPLVSPINVFIWNPVIGQSHVNFLGNIGDLLHRAGHNVTVLSPIHDESLKPFGTKENVTKILIRPKDEVQQWDIGANTGAVWDHDQDPDYNNFHWDDLEGIWEHMSNILKDIMENKPLMQSLLDSKCDVGIFEVNEMSSVAAMEMLGCRKFAIGSAFGQFDYHNSITGIPQFTSFTPSFMTPYTDKMTFYQRFKNLKLMIEGMIALNKQEKLVEKIMEQYRPGFPKLLDTLLKKSAIILINANEFTESPRLRTNMIQYVGGSNCYEKPLSEEANQLLSIRNRTVLFSLGSFAKSCHMPVSVKRAFAEAFASFPDVTFVWKYEECVEREFDKSLYKNIEFSKWVPQNELLNDNRLVLFITHGGMNSILESSHSGTPMITIPIFADQMINSRNAVERGIAIKLDRTHISKEILVKLIGELIGEDSIYRKRALNMKRILSGRPSLYRKRIVDWIERISMEDGPIEHLPLETRNMSCMSRPWKTTQVRPVDRKKKSGHAVCNPGCTCTRHASCGAGCRPVGHAGSGAGCPVNGRRRASPDPADPHEDPREAFEAAQAALLTGSSGSDSDEPPQRFAVSMTICVGELCDVTWRYFHLVGVVVGRASGGRSRPPHEAASEAGPSSGLRPASRPSSRVTRPPHLCASTLVPGYGFSRRGNLTYCQGRGGLRVFKRRRPDTPVREKTLRLSSTSEDSE